LLIFIIALNEMWCCHITFNTNHTFHGKNVFAKILTKNIFVLQSSKGLHDKVGGHKFWDTCITTAVEGISSDYTRFNH
jgi:hypothetical protein